MQQNNKHCAVLLVPGVPGKERSSESSGCCHRKYSQPTCSLYGSQLNTRKPWSVPAEKHPASWLNPNPNRLASGLRWLMAGGAVMAPAAPPVKGRECRGAHVRHNWSPDKWSTEHDIWRVDTLAQMTQGAAAPLRGAPQRRRWRVGHAGAAVRRTPGCQSLFDCFDRPRSHQRMLLVQQEVRSGPLPPGARSSAPFLTCSRSFRQSLVVEANRIARCCTPGFPESLLPKATCAQME